MFMRNGERGEAPVLDGQETHKSALQDLGALVRNRGCIDPVLRKPCARSASGVK
jgi:hypothetical protein